MPSVRLSEFDTWRPGYGLATVTVLQANTTTPASIFSDEDLTQAVNNPQTLAQMTSNGISYGKWAQPLYVGVPYELLINSVDRTGVENVPLTTLDGEDASLSMVTPAGATVATSLADLFARVIDIDDFGEFLAVGENGASAITNNNTLVAAIGAAGGAGGGYVQVPAGTYQFLSLTIPEGVVLRGIGRLGTTLQSTQNGNVITIAGDTAGFERITLDGVNQATGSIGIFAESINFIHFVDFQLKRFDIGLQRKGGTGSHWLDFFISDCFTAGYQVRGDSDNGIGGGISNERWDGGKVELCAGKGIDIKFIDRSVSQLFFAGVGFDNNTGTAVSILGGQQIKFDEDCWWNGNTTSLLIDDASAVSTAGLNKSIGIEVQDASFGPAIAKSGSTPATNTVITLNNTVQNVAFRRTSFANVTVNINSPSQNILVEDCREITGMSFGGNSPTAWTRAKSFNRGESAGLTTGNAATVGWQIELKPGQCVYIEAKVIGRSRSTTDSAFFHIAVSARGNVAALLYDAATANFTAGNVLTGQTSGATARITNTFPSGSTGTIGLQDINGTFLNNETITDSGGGSASANGTAGTIAATLLGVVTAIRAAQKTDAGWDATLIASGPEIQLLVTGATGKNVEWTINCDIVEAGA